uniref:indole-3-pyruvate monooxygenase n=1 Tax=Oryza glumipatula TaxID=40148 RepID=A0A0D9YQA0_9ORYZ
MEEVVVLIIGAGPAGLATAACLTLQHVAYAIIERESCTTSLWRHRTYDRLKLHLAKEFCELPHMAYPSGMPTYVPKESFLEYLDSYTDRFGIQPRYDTSVESATYDQGKKHWAVLAQPNDTGVVARLTARFLIVATGENSAASIPLVPGLAGFEGEAIHSSAYKSGNGYTGKSVLVVGARNSGMEIAYDLATHGAHTSIVVRSPVLEGILKINANNVEFHCGRQIPFDAIVFATGYKSTVNTWLKNGESMFRNDGFPKKKFPNHWRGENGLYCAGFARRGLVSIAMDAKNIVDDIIATMDQVSC